MKPPMKATYAVILSQFITGDSSLNLADGLNGDDGTALSWSGNLTASTGDQVMRRVFLADYSQVSVINKTGGVELGRQVFIFPEGFCRQAQQLIRGKNMTFFKEQRGEGRSNISNTYGTHYMSIPLLQRRRYVLCSNRSLG